MQGCIKGRQIFVIALSSYETNPESRESLPILLEVLCLPPAEQWICPRRHDLSDIRWCGFKEPAVRDVLLEILDQLLDSRIGGITGRDFHREIVHVLRTAVVAREHSQPFPQASERKIV